MRKDAFWIMDSKVSVHHGWRSMAEQLISQLLGERERECLGQDIGLINMVLTHQLPLASP
jgi:hypothetical protein